MKNTSEAAKNKVISKYSTEKVLKKFISLAVAFAIMFNLSYGMFDIKAEAVNESEFAEKIAYLKTQFRQGEYWNYYNGYGNYGSTSPMQTGTTPCPNCSSSGYWSCPGECSDLCGQFYYNKEWVAGQCWGFADLLGNLIFGGNPHKWSTHQNRASIYAGDVIRLTSGHTIFITKVEGDTIYYVDCNASGCCKVNWNNSISRYSLSVTSIYHCSGNNLTGVGSSQPSLSVPSPVNYPVANGNYTLRNCSGAYMMNVYAGTDDNGTKVVTWVEDKSTEQQFRLYHENNGAYWIYAMCSSGGNGRVVDINVGSNGYVNIGDFADIWSRGGYDNCQLFNIVPIGNNKYVFELSSVDNAVLGITANSNGADITLQQYSGNDTQHWYICNYDGQVIDPSPKTDISSCNVFVSDQTYTGSAISPDITVYHGNTFLSRGTDYTVEYGNNTNVGTASVKITGIGNYTGVKTVTFNIAAKSISGTTISAISNHTYTGSEINPSVTVKDGSKTLTKETDYTVEYSNNKNVGTATVTIRGKGNYTGTNIATFKIIAKSIGNATVSSIADQTYTGSKIEPSVTVKDGTKTLVKGTDYTVAYTNNINAGTATVTITGKGNYTGTKTTAFKIVSKTASSFTVSSIANQTYTGYEIEPSITVKDGSMTLTKGTHYTVEYSNNIDVGTATVKITGKGGYTGTKTVTFKIVGKSIANLAFEPMAAEFYYSGKKIENYYSIKDGSYYLKENVDYTLSYKNNVNVGTATCTITGIGNYSGTRTETFRILPENIDTFIDVCVYTSSYEYTGYEIKPDIDISFDIDLVEGVDYTISYQNNINAGEAKVIYSGIGNYTGTIEMEFDILPKDLWNCEISAIDPQLYTGAAVTPKITIKDGNKILKQGTDFSVSCSNNVNPGYATAIITGKGNYTGEDEVVFRIILVHDDFEIAQKEDGSYAIIGYYGTETELTIPSSLNGKKITEIDSAFANNETIENVKISNGITKIGYWAFVGCTNLKNVELPASLTEIGERAFNECSSLTNITIPDGVKTIDIVAFNSCYNLKEITIPNSVKTIGTWAFYLSDNLETVYFNGTKDEWNKISIGTWNDNLLNAKIHFAPAKATNVKAVSGGGNATITWDAVSNATSYRVFRSTSLTGARTLEKVRTSTYYIDTNVDTGKTYYYWIVSYNANTGLKSGYSAYSSVKIVDTFAKSIEIKSASVLSTSVTLKWDMVPGATSYRIYRRNDDGTRKLLYAQSMTEYKDTGLTKGKAYIYEIRAYSKTTGALTAYSAKKTVRPMAAPTILTGNVRGKITWDKNAVATSYRVYRADSLTGAKKLLKPVTTTYYTDTTAESGKTYYYFVAAYDNTTGTLSAYSNAKAIKISK